VTCFEKSLAKSLTRWSEIPAIWSPVVVVILGCFVMKNTDFCLVVAFAHHRVWYRFVMMNFYDLIGWM